MKRPPKPVLMDPWFWVLMCLTAAAVGFTTPYWWWVQ